MRTRRLLPVLFFGSLLLPLGASGQSSPPAQNDTAAAVSPQQVQLARQLVGLLRVDSAAVAGIVAMTDQQVQANPALAPYRAAMAQWATNIFTSDEAKNDFAQLYARNLSEEDLRALVAFFQTPAGQHLSARQGALMSGGALIGRQLAQEHQAELAAKIQQMRSQPQPN
jgi:hypothetical protein